MPVIHDTAIVDPDAKLHDSVKVGPYAIIGPDVKLGKDCDVGAHAVLDGITSFGSNNRIFPYAIIGTEPQDLKFRGGPVRTEIGDNNIFREFVLVKAGTEDGGWVTKIGNDNLLMANAHVAHDCILEDRIVLANNANLAGHVEIESNSVVGGMSGIHQFVRIGQYSMVGGGSLVAMDVAPYCMVSGNRARMYGLNTVGLERNGFSAKDLTALWAAYKLIFRNRMTWDEAKEQLDGASSLHPLVKNMLGFLGNSTRGFCR